MTQGHGWYGFALGLEEAGKGIGDLRSALERHERPTGLGPIEISVTPPPGLALD